MLKCGGYNIEHNFGHSKGTLASVLVVLNLLAFAYNTAASLAVAAWRVAVAATGATYRFFEHLRTITTYVVFQDWPHLLRSIGDGAIRPPLTRQNHPNPQSPPEIKERTHDKSTQTLNLELRPVNLSDGRYGRRYTRIPPMTPSSQAKSGTAPENCCASNNR